MRKAAINPEAWGEYVEAEAEVAKSAERERALKAARAAMPRQPSESEILAAIQLALGARPGIRLFRMNVGTARDPTTGQVVKFGVPGMADLLCLTARGQYLWLEIKSATGRLRPDQIRFRDFIAAFAGAHHYAVARSVAEAEQALARLENPCSP